MKAWQQGDIERNKMSKRSKKHDAAMIAALSGDISDILIDVRS